MKRIGLSGLLLAVTIAAQASPQFISRADLRQRLAAEIPAKALSPGDDPVARIRAASALAATDPVIGEWRLRELVLQVAQQRGSPELRGALQTLATREPQALTEPEDPDQQRSGRHVPVADVAAAARSTLRQWDFDATADRYVSAWTRGVPVSEPLDEIPAHRALIRLDDTQLRQVLDTQLTDLPVEALAAELPRSRDARAWGRVLRDGRGAASVAAVASIPDQMATDEALTRLESAARNPALASAAMRAMAVLMPRSPAARTRLFDHLADPATGSAAAQALAAGGDPLVVVPALAQRLEPGGDDLARRRALVALMTIGDRSAREVLRRFVDDPRQSEALRSEVAGWQP